MCCANSEKQWITSARRRGAVQEWQERQIQKRDTATVIPLARYGAHPPRDAAYEALTADLKNHAIRPEASEIEDLFHAIERLYEELKAIELGRRHSSKRCILKRKVLKRQSVEPVLLRFND